MLKNFLNIKSSTVTSAAIVIAVASLFSRILGVVRDRVLAGLFGAGNELDIYYAAFRVPDLIYNIIVLGALSAGFIPVFVRLLRNEDDNSYKMNENAWNFTNNVANILVLFLIVVGAVLIIFCRPLVSFITPGFSGEKLEMTIALTRIMFLSPILLGLSGIVGSVLQSFKRFLIFSLAPIFYNIGIIIGAMFLVSPFGLYGLAVGVVIGAFFHLLMQLPTLRGLGYRYKFLLNFRDSNFIEVLKLTGPRILGLISTQINLIVTTMLASLSVVGSLAIFNLANNLQSFPIGLFGVSFAIAVFPSLSRSFAEKKETDFRNQFLGTFKQIMFFIIPISILFIILRIQIVRVIFGVGKFDWANTILTADALGVFCLSLFAQALLPLLARAFYARRNTWIPFAVSVVSVIANLLISWWAIEPYGVLGLAFGFAISSIINFILLVVFLKLENNDIFHDSLLIALSKIFFAAVVMGVVTQYVKTGLGLIINLDRFFGVFAQGVIAGLVGLGVFGLIAYWLRSEELLVFLASLRRKVFRNTKLVHEKIEPEL